MKKEYNRTTRNMIIAAVLGLLAYLSLGVTVLYSYEQYLPEQLTLLWDAIPLIIVSAIVNIFNGKTVKEKAINFLIVTGVAYLIVLVFSMMQFISYTMG